MLCEIIITLVHSQWVYPIFSNRMGHGKDIFDFARASDYTHPGRLLNYPECPRLCGSSQTMGGAF